jgi:hypothetical protein
MYLQVELFREALIAMWASVLDLPNMDHIGMFVKITLLREPHRAVFTFVWLLPGVCSQMIEVLTDRER